MSYTDTDGTIRFNSNDIGLLAAADDIKKTFVSCPIQKIAHEALVGDVLQCDFEWTSTVGGETISHRLRPDQYEYSMWTQFSRSVLLQICLYGYAVYRLVKVPRKDSLSESEVSPDFLTSKRRRVENRRKYRKVPEVADGQLIVLRWKPKAREWIPYGRTGAPFLRSDGWRMIMLNEPMKWGHDSVPIYQSFAANATKMSQLYKQINDNIESRDNTNTEIGVFTQMLKNVVASGNGVSTKPWFQPSVHGAMSAAPGDLHQPFEMKVADRLEAAMGLKTATDKFRVFKEASPLGGGAGAVEPPDDKPMRHYEHVITDGFDAREVSFRRAPEDMIRLLDMLFNLILFTYSVMPQVIGKNINSERNAASNRIAEVSIERYNESVRHLRQAVQLAIMETSIEAVGGDESTFVKMVPCTKLHTLRTIESIITTDAARKLYACIFGIPEDYIDEERLRQKQELMVQMVSQPSTRNKLPMTEDQKAASMKAKNEPR